MTRRQLAEAMTRLCGKERGTRSRFAALLGLHRSTVGRYLDDEIPIPEVVAVAVRHLVVARQQR